MRVLLEKDLRKVLIKNGLSQNLADWAHSVDSKYSGFVANAAFFSNSSYIQNPAAYEESDRYELYKPRIRDVISRLFKNPIKPQLPIQPNKMTLQEAEILLGQLDYMRDWFDNPARENKEDPTKLSWEEALRFAEEYHAEQAEKAGSTTLTVKAGQEIIIRFPDGFYWVRLGKRSCREEADAMGHCGTAQKGELYSLRDRNGYPYITAAIDVDKESSEQIYGRANTKPKEKYHKKILELLGELDIKKVSTKDYNDESFDVEDDVSDELKEWFEEEFGYYPTKGGITEKERKEAEQYLQEQNQSLNHISIDVDWGAYDEYISASCYMSIDISEYNINRSLPKEVLSYESFKIPFGRVEGDFPGDNVEVQLYEYQDKVQINFYSRTGDFNLEDGVGSVIGSYTSFDNLTNWIDAMISDAEQYEKEFNSYLVEFFEILTDNDIITQSPPLLDLIEFTDKSGRFTYDDEDGCYAHIVIPEKKASGAVIQLIQDEDLKNDYVEKLNNLRVIDTYGFRRGGEYAEQLSFKDFFENLEDRKFKDYTQLFKIEINQNVVMIMSSPLFDLNYQDQVEVIKILKFFDKNWSDLVFYIGSLIGINGEQKRIETLKLAERMKELML